MKSLRNKTIDFSIEEGKPYLEKCVKVEEVEKIPKNKIVIGDLFSAIDKIEDNSIDLLIADPPYNLFKNFHGNEFKKTSSERYIEYTKSWLYKIIPKLKNTASVYVCCDWYSAISIGEILDEKMKLRNRITWQREKGRGAKSNWKNSMEDIFFATVSDDYTFNIDDVKVRKKVLAPYTDNGSPKDWEETEDGKFRNTYPSNFWDDISVPYWSMPENTAHPTQKPEKLIAKLVLASTNKNDVVLDIFGGSGTSAVVAKKLNRDFITIEQNPLYCAWAQKRLELAETDTTIQGYSGGVFWERNSKPNTKKD